MTCKWFKFRKHNAQVWFSLVYFQLYDHVCHHLQNNHKRYLLLFTLCCGNFFHSYCDRLYFPKMIWYMYICTHTYIHKHIYFSFPVPGISPLVFGVDVPVPWSVAESMMVPTNEHNWCYLRMWLLRLSHENDSFCRAYPLGHSPLEPSHHIVRKPMLHEEADRVQEFWPSTERRTQLTAATNTSPQRNVETSFRWFQPLNVSAEAPRQHDAGMSHPSRAASEFLTHLTHEHHK